MSRRLSLAARWRLLRHSAVALLMSVVIGSGVVGFAAGQVAVHLTGGLALTPPVTHQQQSGQVQGALGQRVGSQVAHQSVVRAVYVPPSAPAASTQANAHPRQSGASGGKHADNGHGKGSGHGKHGRGDKGDHGQGHGDGEGGDHGQGHGDGEGGDHGHGHGDNGHGNGGGPQPQPQPPSANPMPQHGHGHGDGHGDGHG